MLGRRQTLTTEVASLSGLIAFWRFLSPLAVSNSSGYLLKSLLIFLSHECFLRRGFRLLPTGLTPLDG